MLVQGINTAARRVPTGAIYLALALPAPWLFWQAATGAMGAEPIRALEHAYGEWALTLLVAGLTITPLRRFAGLNLLRFRRALGLMAFFYVLAHLMVWLLVDVRQPALIWADIIKRPYITVGMVGFALLVPLALTSTDRAVRRLGRRWHRLHRLVYAAALLGGVHYVMLSKGWQVEPLLWLAAILGLLMLRLRIGDRAGPRMVQKSADSAP